MQDVWTTRDLPVLVAVVEALQDFDQAFTGGVRASSIADRTGVALPAVVLSFRTLDDAGLIEVTKVMGGGGANWRAVRVSGRALQLVGAWPTPEGMAERILRELEAAAEAEPDAEKRGKLRAAAAVLGRGAVDTTSNVLAAVIARAMFGA